MTAAAGGAPIADVFVNLINSSGASVGGANTDASGAFTTGAVPPGTYYATTFANSYVHAVLQQRLVPERAVRSQMALRSSSRTSR